MSVATLSRPESAGLSDVGARVAAHPRARRVPEPRVELFSVDGFLTPAQCAGLVERIEAKRRPSTIANSNGDPLARTSETCELQPDDPVVAVVDAALAALTGLEPDHGEPLQGQRYAVGQEFKRHTDYFEPGSQGYDQYCGVSGQRTWTVMVYLNEPLSGGATDFPRAKSRFQPRVGTAVCWNNQTLDGAPNPMTLHHGMPVELGTKYIVTKWFRENVWGGDEEAYAARGGAAAAQPAVQQSAVQTGKPVDDEWRRWVGENLLLGSSHDSLVQTMAAAGFDRLTARREIEAAAASPYLASSQRLVGRLGKRDWLFASLGKLGAMDQRLREVPRIDRIDPERFRDEFYLAHRPVLLTGLMDGWPALETWSIDYFEQALGDRLVEVQDKRGDNADYERQKEAHRGLTPFRDFAARVRAGESNDFYLTAANDAYNKAALEPLRADLGQMPGILNPDERGGFIWIGPKGTVTPFHHDLTNNLIAQAVGRKRVLLIPSWEAVRMRNHSHCFSDWTAADLTGAAAPDRPRPLEVVIGPGEALFVPVGWWHHVEGLDVSVTLTYTNFIWDNDFSSFYGSYGAV